MARLSKKAIDAKVNAAYRKVGNGVVIDVMDIGKVLGAGRAVASLGGDDALIEAAMADVLAAVRKN